VPHSLDYWHLWHLVLTEKSLIGEIRLADVTLRASPCACKRAPKPPLGVGAADGHNARAERHLAADSGLAARTRPQKGGTWRTTKALRNHYRLVIKLQP